MHTLKQLKLIPVMMGVLVLVGCSNNQFPVPNNFVAVNTVIYQKPNDKLYLYNLNDGATREVDNKGIYSYNGHIKWIKQTEEFKQYQFLEMSNWNSNPRFASLRSLLKENDLRYYEHYFSEDQSSNGVYISNDLSMAVRYTQTNNATNLNVSTINGSEHKLISINGWNSVFNISDNHKYLYLKSASQGSTPAGDLTVVNITAGTYQSIAIPEYFAHPFISHSGEQFIISQYPEILGDGSYVENGYKMLLFSLNTTESKVLNVNSTSEYINVRWHSNDQKFIYQTRPTIHSGLGRTEISSQDCASSIYEYDLNLDKMNTLISDDPNECLLLFGYNPNNEDEIYFQSKDINKNVYAFEKYTISTRQSQTIFEDPEEFEVHNLTYIE